MAKKRANGEGNIRKRKDGRWEGRYTAGSDPQTGKPISKNVLGKTQAEVREKLKEAMAEAEKIDVTRSEDFTLAQWLRYWLDNYGQVYLQHSSQVNYEGFLKNQITHDPIASVKIKKLTTHDLQFFFNRMRVSGRVQRKESEKKPAGLAGKSIRNMYFFMSHALDRAVIEKLIPENPAKGVVLPKKEKPEMKTLPLEDLKKFFQEAKNSGVFELYYTELATGLRRGELLGLKWEDLDFTANSIYVHCQITRMDGKVQESPLKTGNAYRSIIVAEDVMNILKEKKEREDGFSKYVFSSPSGGPISPDSVLNMLHRVLKRAGLDRVRFHDLRHTFATLALQNGVDIKTVSGMLGHFSAGFTLDTYAHVTTAAQKEAANTMGNILTQS